MSYRKVYGVGAEFSCASDLYSAAEATRDGGFVRWDVYSPFPIHGMDRAMGLGKSWLSALVLCGGVTGLLAGVCLTTIPSFGIYPMIVHGKPFDWRTLPAFFPICFELTVLFSAFATVSGLLLLNRLPRWNHPVFNLKGFERATDDRFFLVIEARDERFSLDSTCEHLRSLGAISVSTIYDEV